MNCLQILFWVRFISIFTPLYFRLLTPIELNVFLLAVTFIVLFSEGVSGVFVLLAMFSVRWPSLWLMLVLLVARSDLHINKYIFMADGQNCLRSFIVTHFIVWIMGFMWSQLLVLHSRTEFLISNTTYLKYTL